MSPPFVLPLFKPSDDMPFQDFMLMLSRHCISTDLFMVIQSKIVKFIKDMHDLGLDKELDAKFFHNQMFTKNGQSRPAVFMRLTAHGELKGAFAISLSPNHRHVVDFDALDLEQYKLLADQDLN